MKLVMSTTVAGVVLSLLAPGLAEAANRDCTSVVKECRMSVGPIGTGTCTYWNQHPLGRYAMVSACIRARSCVPQFPPRALN
jgi:hypothetical protein